MNHINPSFTGKPNLHRAKPGAPPDDTATPAATIRTTGREYANPVDYSHPYESMARFAEFLALQYDANRTRHAYYRQVRFDSNHTKNCILMRRDGIECLNGSLVLPVCPVRRL